MNAPQKQGWIAWFACNPVAANLLMTAILVLGLSTVLGMRTEGFPASEPRTVSVEADFDGASPRDVEEGAAIKIEQALNGTEGIKKISSVVTASGVTVSVQSIDGYSLPVLKEAVQSRVDAISSFPEQVTRTAVTAELEERHVIFVQVSGNGSHRSLKEAARRVRKDLLALPSISKVSTEGARGYEVTVELSEGSLRAYGLSFGEVASALQGRSVNLSAGMLETQQGTFTLQSRSQAYFGAELAQTVVRSSPEGGIVRLREVARIVDGFAEDPVISVYNGLPSIRLDVQLTGKDSITAASDTVATEIADIRSSGWLPQDIELATWMDEAKNIRDRLALMSTNAMVGMGLVFVMLALFLNIRVALWVAAGIPISFAGAFFVIGPIGFDYSLNDLTTFALIIVLGIVVDDAIVTGEAIYARKEREGGGVETTVRGALDVATPATFGLLTTVAAFFPLTLISSDFGGPFKIIATVVIICLLFSLVESKLILPAHLAHLNVKGRPPRSRLARGLTHVQCVIERALASFISRLYLPVLRAAVNNLLASILLALAVFFAAVGLVSRGIVPVQFFPDRDASLVFAEVTLQSGTPAAMTRAAAEQIGRSLVSTAEIYQDRYDLADSPVRNSYVSSTRAERVTISVELPSSAGRSFSAAEFVADWRAGTGRPQAVKHLDFYSDDGDIDDLRIEFSHDDPAVAEQAMRSLRDIATDTPGVSDVRTNLDNSMVELSIEVLPLGERLGITNLSLISQLRNSIHGFEAQKIQRGEDEISLRIRFPKHERDSRADLDRVRIATPLGGTVPLTSVAKVTARDAQQEYTRIDGLRVLTLDARTDRDEISPQAFLDVLQARVLPDLQAQYPDLVVKIGGEAEQESAATAQLAAGFGMALIAIYALLAIPLRSYLDPLVIMCAIPFGIVGAILGHLVIGIPVSLLSFFGILALSGVVVNDALVLASHYRARRNAGLSYKEAILESGPARLRAILLTSVTTFAGLAPLILETSEQAQFLIPMAVSLAFGLLFATVITLLIVPVMLGVRDRLFPARGPNPVPKESL